MSAGGKAERVLHDNGISVPFFSKFPVQTGVSGKEREQSGRCCTLFFTAICEIRYCGSCSYDYPLFISDSVNNSHAVVVLPKKLPAPYECTRRPLICVKKNGLPYHHDTVESALVKMGLNSHSFRHTHATCLIEAGANLVDVAARLGHTDATITQNLYAHDTEDMKRKTARIFEKIVDK